ncbi:glucose-1-phosphate thymidylyltransferase [Patescibacteria group bacterium]|nr:MAG: glucose-1-phosphate thymidylyltransferase [Patescibacteria group bacterium]
MKALIAAGGRATRLRPITWTTNKHLIPLANKPMLAHVIEKIVEAGITDIIVNVNPGEVESMSAVLGDGSAFGAKLTYLEQVGGAKGVAHVVANAEAHLKGERFLFFLGDNIILGSIKKFVERFEAEKLDCMLAFSRVKDPARFGVPEFDAAGNLVRVVEKPEHPPSPFAVTGIYLYDERFFDAFKTIQPSARGEYEISDVNSWYVKNGKVGYEEITGWWKDTGTPDALLEGNALIMDDLARDQFRVDADIPDSSQVQGLVSIGKGTAIGADVLIRGPVVIGKDCVLEHCYVGPYTAIGDGCTVKNAELEHSVLFPGARVETGRRIVNSLLGFNATVSDSRETHPKSGHRMVVGDDSLVEL